MLAGNLTWKYFKWMYCKKKEKSLIITRIKELNSLNLCVSSALTSRKQSRKILNVLFSFFLCFQGRYEIIFHSIKHATHTKKKENNWNLFMTSSFVVVKIRIINSRNDSYSECFWAYILSCRVINWIKKRSLINAFTLFFFLFF